ncbi:MAG TPA: xanthine dehydrogenase family protein molybdopterin-binding subunit [Conexibacter sp.]|jgi:carbon-monoxide dehydrogenase large subunit
MTEPPTRSGAVGKPLPRVEDRPLLVGSAEFVGDIELPEMLHAAFVRSSVAHARVLNVETAAARALPGVHDVVSAAELDLAPLVAPIENPEATSPPRPLLATDRVRFVGEAIAVVVADDVYRAEDGAARVEVALDPLNAVVDPNVACEAGATTLHGGSNVLYDHHFEEGDVDDAFANAHVVIERTFRNPRYAAAPMEGRGVVAAPDGDGVVLWSSTQAPHRLATIVAELLGLPNELVRVRCPDVGGGFGQKAHVYPEEVLVAWLALRLCRPVRWLEDRAENLLVASHARDQHVNVRVAADADGRLLALDADVICDTGAYGVFPHGHLLEALGTPTMLPGPYELRAYRYRSRSVATNKAPEGAYRGVGLPVAAFVHERLMDILAGELALDPAEIRRRNLIRHEQLPYTTLTRQRYDSGDYHEALERALTTIGWEDQEAWRASVLARGRLPGAGISCYVEYTGINSMVFHGRGMVGIAGFDSAHVALDGDGRVTVWTTLPGIGQGTSTTFAQMVADHLEIDVARVTVANPDTAVGALHGTGTFASRSAIAGGGAIAAAAGELRRRLLEDAANLLEAAAGDVELRDGHVGVVGSPTPTVAVRDLVEAAERDRYRVSAAYDPPAIAYPYATHVCLVEIHPETGAVELARYVIVEDCGSVINPLIVEGQIHGATAQGIGGTMLEELVYGDDGQLTTGSFMDYLLPTANDLPAFEVSHLAHPAPGSEGGAKGVGEGGTLAPPGALANAVSDALGCEMNTLPLRPETVWAQAQAAPAPLSLRPSP